MIRVEFTYTNHSREGKIMLRPEIGETVEWRTVTGVWTGVVSAILSKKEILVGFKIVQISDLTAIIG